MKTMAVSEFKAHALEVMGRVAETREPVLVVKRGKPLVKVVPFTEQQAVPGKLADALVFEEDIVSPLGEDMWNACK